MIDTNPCYVSGYETVRGRFPSPRERGERKLTNLLNSDLSHCPPQHCLKYPRSFIFMFCPMMPTFSVVYGLCTVFDVLASIDVLRTGKDDTLTLNNFQVSQAEQIHSL